MKPATAGLSPEETEARMLERFEEGAKICRRIEEQLRSRPVPEMESVIRLHRVLVLKLSVEAEGAPELFQLVNTLMQPLLSWERLAETRKTRELAEQKYQDHRAEEKAEEEKANRGPNQGLSPETLETIERELNLF